MSELIKYPAGTVFLKNVRLAFPDLYVAKTFKGEGAPKYGATFLVTPGSENDIKIEKAIVEVSTPQWGDKTALVVKSIIGQPLKWCYLDGDLKEYDGFAGMKALSAKRRETDGPVLVLDRDTTPLTAESGRPYGGCYVNARVQLWAQKNEWGNGMRATLVVVQFLNDGDSFGGASKPSAAGFDSVEDEASDLV